MSLNRISENVYVLEGVVNIGVIVKDKNAVIVDTGLGDSGARKVRRWLDENKIHPCAIINTHSHADHFGGNAFLLKKYPEMKVFAPEIEDAFIRYPVLEPAFLFGSEPPDELKTGFLMSDTSRVDENLQKGGMEICGIELEVVPLPGHSFNQMGILTGDVLFSADSVFVEELIEKYGILYFVDYGESVETLEKLRKYTGFKFVPGHRKIENIEKVIDANLRHFETVSKAVRNCLEQDKPISCIFEKFRIPENPINRSLSLVSIKATLRNLGVDYFGLI